MTLKKSSPFLTFLLVCLFFSANQQMTFAQNDYLYAYPREDEEPFTNSNPVTTGAVDCNNLDPNDPCPFDDEPIKYVNVNFHFIQTAWGAGNFSATGDGAGGTYNGFQRAEDIINVANQQMEENGNCWGVTPANANCKINIRLVLQGVYFHRTNLALHSFDPPEYKVLIRNGVGSASATGPLWGYMQNNRVNPNSEINIYSYNSDVASGVTNGIVTNIHNDWNKYIQYERDQTNGTAGVPTEWAMWSSSKILLHEIFHNGGLWIHPFQGNDGCDDTPVFPNAGSNQNNLMDYNSYEDWCLSPCQICRLNEGLDPDEYEEREEDDCPPLSNFFTIRNEICSDDPQIFLEGSASFNETKHFIEIFEVASVGSNDVQGGYASHWFNGEIGKVNLGEYACYGFECGKVYRIKLAVSNECEEWSESVQYATINCPPCDVEEEACCVELFSVSPNPGNDVINVSYDLLESRNVSITLHDQFSGQLCGTIKNQLSEDSGSHAVNFNISSYSEGLYFIRLLTDDELLTTQFSIAR